MSNVVALYFSSSSHLAGVSVIGLMIATIPNARLQLPD